MVKKKQFFITVFTLAGFLLVLFTGCEEEEDSVESLTESSIVTTLPLSEITDSTVNTGGVMKDTSYAKMDSIGLVYGLSSNPTLKDNAGLISADVVLDTFEITVSNLSSANEYYLRTFAVSSEGIVYGEELSFRTIESGNGVVDIDGNQYHTVIIGEQEWMAENLKTTKYNDGKNILQITDNDEWSSINKGAYAWYKNNEKYADDYGGLYNWYTVETGKLCPDGWRVPTNNDWKELVDFLAGKGYNGSEALVLKSRTGWKGNSNGTDRYGFNALPAGNRHYNGSFNTIDYDVTWWTSTEKSSSKANSRFLKFYDDKVTNINYDKNYGFSVRCIKE